MDEYEGLSHSRWECKYHVVPRNNSIRELSLAKIPSGRNTSHFL
jgi:hypothetical protein